MLRRFYLANAPFGFLFSFCGIFCGAGFSSADDHFSAEDRIRWEQAASGNHSLRSLGPQFYVDLPMREIPNARMAYFNYRLAERMGLKVPSDPKELEALMKRLFAVEIDPTGNSERKMMATRYLDGPKKASGEAMGDGRAAWAGEIRTTLPNGKILNLDIVAKGIGQTPLAWTNRADGSHSDGRQSDRELVRSVINSRANVGNELDSTDDLVGFVIPESDYLRTIGVRVGNQTRVAHLRYYEDEPENFAKIFEYVIRRDLGLPEHTKISAAEVTEYVESFVKNLAEETARYTDLNAIHGAPTAGNRTTKGSTIDLAEFWYHDAHHKKFSYLYGNVSLEEQVAVMRGYVFFIIEFANRAKYPIPLNLSRTALSAQFNRIYSERVSELSANRVGLSENEVKKMSKRTLEQFARAVEGLRYAMGETKKRIFSNDILPAAFDIRRVFADTFANIASPGRKEIVFANERNWATSTEKYVVLKNAYLKAVDAIVTDMGEDGRPKVEWIRKAKTLNGVKRMEPGDGRAGSPDDPFYRAHDEKILRVLYSDGFDFRIVNEMIDQAAADLIDRGLSPRGMTNLGTLSVNPCLRLLSATQ